MSEIDPYAATSVPAIKSQETIRTMLRTRGVTGLQTTETWGSTPALVLRFGMPRKEGGYLAVRILVPVPPAPTTRMYRGYTETTDENWRAQWTEQKERQLWRVLWWWLKTNFEAADVGLVRIEEALFPWLELPDGSTIMEQAHGQLEKLLAGTAPLQLGTGR